MPSARDHIERLLSSFLAERDFDGSEVKIADRRLHKVEAELRLMKDGDVELSLQRPFDKETKEWIYTASAIWIHRPYFSKSRSISSDLLNYCAAIRSLTVRPFKRTKAECGECPSLSECRLWTETDGNICLRALGTLLIRRHRNQWLTLASSIPQQGAEVIKVAEDFSARVKVWKDKARGLGPTTLRLKTERQKKRLDVS